jgi:hypothetical protein
MLNFKIELETFPIFILITARSERFTIAEASYLKHKIWEEYFLLLSPRGRFSVTGLPK